MTYAEIVTAFKQKDPKAKIVNTFDLEDGRKAEVWSVNGALAALPTTPNPDDDSLDTSVEDIWNQAYKTG